MLCPIRFQGQWEDAETGLHYNYHRYYDPVVGHYISVDPARFFGGTLQTAYTGQPTQLVDPLGLVPTNDPGWNLYHIVKNINGQDIVCYVGITQNIETRRGQHSSSGLIGSGMRLVADISVSSVSYATARGAEQADIDAFGARVLSHRGRDIADVGTANRANSISEQRRNDPQNARDRAFRDGTNRRNNTRCCGGAVAEYLSRTGDCDS